MHVWFELAMDNDNGMDKASAVLEGLAWQPCPSVREHIGRSRLHGNDPGAWLNRDSRLYWVCAECGGWWLHGMPLE